MSMRNALLVLSAGLCGIGAVLADDGPGLGQELTATELAAVDFTIMPDGDGLPPGSGNAMSGKDIYTRNCLACHGENGTGGVNDVLSGGLQLLELWCSLMK